MKGDFIRRTKSPLCTKKYDLLSVDFGWSEGQRKDLRRIALSFLDLRNREIYCTYRPNLSIKEFLSLLKNNLKIKGIVLLDIPLKGKSEGFFRPVERVMQRVGIPCRPSRDALIRGKGLLSRIEPLGFKVIEIYPFEFYKFFCLLPFRKSNFLRKIYIEPMVFKKFFPPYKRSGEEGLKNAKKIIKQLLSFLRLRLINEHELWDRKGRIRWDIYDSLFGVIAGYLLLRHSPWVKFIRDNTGSEILLLSDVNLGDLFDLYITR